MLNISSVESNLLISRLVNHSYSDIKKLPQADRKICLKAIERFSSAQDKRLAINLSQGTSFPQKVENIQTILQSKINPKKITLAKLITSVFKGILNILHLRVGSETLYKRIEAIKDKFLTQNWDQYLKDNFEEIGSNCNRDEANIFFLGDCHTDLIQHRVRENIIRYYAQADNVVLFEGVSNKKINMTKRRKKNFSFESWENEEHHKRHIDNVNELIKLIKQLKAVPEIFMDMNSLDASMQKIDQIDIQIQENLQKDNELKKIRDQDLIQKVKDVSTLKPHQKIFVVAGSLHLKDEKNDYKILNSFHEHKCTMMIPKESNKGEEDMERFVEKAIESGSLKKAYEYIYNER